VWRWIGDWFEICVSVAGVALGAVAALIAMETAHRHVDVSFYDTIAQILPVFLVALAVEQKLIDRLGITEDEYVKRADRALDLAISAEQADREEEYIAAQEFQDSFDSEPRFAWVHGYVDEVLYESNPTARAEVAVKARDRYRRERLNEALFVAIAIMALIVGESAALGGMLHGGSSRCSLYLGLSIGSTVAVIVALTFSGARELVNSLRR
jgi:hypothetical protein